MVIFVDVCSEEEATGGSFIGLSSSFAVSGFCRFKLYLVRSLLAGEMVLVMMLLTPDSGTHAGSSFVFSLNKLIIELFSYLRSVSIEEVFR